MMPDSHTIQEFYLDVSYNHQLYIQEWGNPEATSSIIYLHGGPGSGVSNSSKQRFDPEIHHVIFFDQRGSGRSLPAGKLQHNNVGLLEEDINSIVDKLKLKNLILIGGSWGSTLALYYAIKNPRKVKALILDGVFTGTKAEAEWLDNGKWRTFFPEVWQKYADSVPKEYSDNPSEYIIRQSQSKNKSEFKKAIYNYVSMEAALLKLDSSIPLPELEVFDETAGAIELHYLRHNWFLTDNYIIKNAHKLAMPVVLIQGRYDMVCPPKTAYTLSKELPNCRLIWTINGHIKQHESHTVFNVVLNNLTDKNDVSS
jgi:proline iminopeptidase